MKRFLVLLAVLPLFNATAFGAIRYNNENKDVMTKTLTYNGEVMIEARKAFESFGYSCGWDKELKSAVFTKGGSKVAIALYSNEMYINGVLYECENPPKVEDDIIFVPVSLLSELGMDIGWDFEEKVLLFESENSEEVVTDSLNGWNQTHTSYYYNGDAVTGENYIDGKMYLFDDEGVLRQGISKQKFSVTNGYNEYGFPYYGYVIEENKTYYFKNGAVVYTEPTMIEGNMYNFNSNGYYTVGWHRVNGEIRYNDSFGYPANGVFDIDGVKYLFKNGIMQTGEQVYDGKRYFIYNDGVMLVNKIRGNYYYGRDGVGVEFTEEYRELIEKSESVLGTSGRGIENIYDYVTSHVKYKFMKQDGWQEMAQTSLSTGRGACYNFAACMDILMNIAGYETRVIRGTARGPGLHYWNQVKVNGSWINIDACNKFFNVSDAYLKSLNYTFDEYEYPNYNY